MTNNVHSRAIKIMDTLNRRIFNIAAISNQDQYKIGHRDARHAACELIGTANAEFSELLDDIVTTYVVAIVHDHEIHVHVASTEEAAENIVLAYVQNEYDYDGETYDASAISEELGSMGASLTWTIKKKMNPHFMDLSAADPEDEYASNGGMTP